METSSKRGQDAGRGQKEEKKMTPCVVSALH